MATVIVVSNDGEVRITVDGDPIDTDSDLSRQDLVRAVHGLSKRLDALDAKCDRIIRLVRRPTSLVLHVGTPTQKD